MPHYILLTQVYPPDAAAVGQHFEDAAVRLAERGYRVTVYTADRDYDDPRIRYSAESRHPGVKVVRLRWSSFGKRTVLHRLAGQVSYLGQVFLRLLIQRGVDGLVLTTIPATTGMMIGILRLLRRYPYLYWVMDINPDQAVALGIFREGSLPVRILRASNRRLVRSAAQVVVLDRYMRERIEALLPPGQRPPITVIPPWPLEDHLEPVPREDNPFLKAHGLTGKRCIFMYSGNHSLVHPLEPFLEAIKPYKDRDDLAFLFVGGGRGKAAVERFIEAERPVNVLSLPYQPLDQLKYSLSAADVQVVVMGAPMVGMVHPCKIYGAMAVARPVLYIGPRHSPLGELVESGQFGWVADPQGEPGIGGGIETLLSLEPDEREALGTQGRNLLQKSLNADALATRFCDLLEGRG